MAELIGMSGTEINLRFNLVLVFRKQVVTGYFVSVRRLDENRWAPANDHFKLLLVSYKM